MSINDFAEMIIGSKILSKSHYLAPTTITEIKAFQSYAEIQDGHQKSRKNKFWEKSPVDCADILRVKNFVKIVISFTVSKIYALLPQDGHPKNCGKMNFGKSYQQTLQIPCGSKILSKSLYLVMFPR